MPESANISRNTNALREEIVAELLDKGSATTHVSEIGVPLAAWRKIARAAARQIGRPVETVANEDRAWVALRDWPATPQEEDKQRAAVAAAIHADVRRQELVSAIAAMETRTDTISRQLLRLAKHRDE